MQVHLIKDERDADLCGCNAHTHAEQAGRALCENHSTGIVCI